MSSDLRKKKVLFLLQLPPPIYGATIVGKEIYSSKFINSCFDSYYLSITLTKDLNHPESAFSRLIHYFSVYFKTIALLLSHRFDLCYLAITCHGVGFLKDSLFVLTCKLFCKKIVIHQHNKGMSIDSHKPVYRFLYRHVYNKSKVILLSDLLYDDISSHVNREQVMVCPNGSPWLVPPGGPVIAKSSPPHIVFLSNLFWDKGIITFLDCCEKLKEKGVTFQGDMIGSETSDCNKVRLQEEIDKRGLKDIVSYLGHLTGEDRDQIMLRGTYFLFPTKNEAFPLVLLEALQFRILCLTTPVGGIKDIIHHGETGFICSPEDFDGFSKIIIDMESNPDQREKIVQNAFSLFQNEYTLESFEKRFVSCLNKALE